MTFVQRMVRVCAASAVAATGACSDETATTGQHDAFLSGYVYNGATGARLAKAQLTAISIKYRDKVIPAVVEEDGRFLTTAPLPTWQDYAVYIGAPGFRPFVSRNPGFDVPPSLSMTESLAEASTTQTFQMEASLFPADLKAPKLTLTIDQADALSTTPPPPRATGTVRLRPESSSVLEGGQGQPSLGFRRWRNTEDLLTQTVTKPFIEGQALIAEGELLYGVAYEVTVFGVAGYQPIVLPDPVVAGQVSSRTIVIAKEQQDPLRITLINTDNCVPPGGKANEYGAVFNIDFNAPVEFVNANAAEDIDNGVSVSVVAGGFGQTCPLKTSTSSTVQERGTKTTIVGNRLTLSFNPALGFATTTLSGFMCTAPDNLNAVTYGNLGSVSVRPVGDQTRKRSLAELVSAYQAGSGFTGSTLVCGSRLSQGF